MKYKLFFLYIITVICMISQAQTTNSIYVWKSGIKTMFVGADSITFPTNVHKMDYKNLTYKIDGKTFKMVRVDGNNLPSFYIMQTEIPPSAEFQIGDVNIGRLSGIGDAAVLKSEYNAFISKIREATGIHFRLPSEAEWVYAARGGQLSKGYTYCGSNNIEEVAWYQGNSYNETHKVALKKSNELGLYDMSGNYAEVCLNPSRDDEDNIDGNCFGGSWKSTSSSCLPSSSVAGSTSGQISGTTYKEKNAFDARYITIRLVYSVPDNE